MSKSRKLCHLHWNWTESKCGRQKKTIHCLTHEQTFPKNEGEILRFLDLCLYSPFFSRLRLNVDMCDDFTENIGTQTHSEKKTTNRILFFNLFFEYWICVVVHYSALSLACYEFSTIWRCLSNTKLWSPIIVHLFLSLSLFLPLSSAMLEMRNDNNITWHMKQQSIFDA